MPLREYVTPDDKWIEVLIDGEPPETIDLADGRTATLCRVPIVARTANRWGDTNEKPHFNRGLQRWVSGAREAEQIAHSRGLVCHRELGTESEVESRHESYLSRVADQNAAEEAELDEYNTNLTKFGGDAARASCETWTASRILNGKTVFARS